MKSLRNNFYSRGMTVIFLFATLSLSCSSQLKEHKKLTIQPNNYRKNISAIHKNYWEQKKYDILEKSLITEHDRYTKNNYAIGQLYTALDLAHFYSNGFINFKKSQIYYDNASKINKEIKERKFKEKIKFYRTEGNFSYQKKYNFQEIDYQIKNGLSRVERILEGNDKERPYILSLNDKIILPDIKTVITKRYDTAIIVNTDILDPRLFDAYEEKLLKTCHNYFKRRYKLTKEEKTYFIHYSVVKGLIRSFDIFSLTLPQVERILDYIQNAKTYRPINSVSPQNLYLQFGLILCLSRVQKHVEAVDHFNKFQEDVITLQQMADTYIASLRKAKEKTALKAKSLLALDFAVALLTGYASGGKTSATLFGGGETYDKLNSEAKAIQRQIRFVGESKYSKDINSVLNIDEQLQLYRAIGDSFKETGQTSKSILFYKEAINVISNMRSTISTEMHRISYASYKDKIFNNLIDALILSKQIKEAFEYAEVAKSRALVDLLGSKKGMIKFKNAGITNLIDKEREAQINKDYTQKHTGITDKQVEHINSLSFMSSERRGLTLAKNISNQKKIMFGSDEELMSLITVAKFKLEDIQEILPINYSLLEFYITDKSIFAWVIDKTQIKFLKIKLKPIEAKLKIDAIDQKIKSISADVNKISQELYEELFKPIEKEIKNNKIYIANHRFLHGFPFELLYDGNSYLVERYSFTYLPSASILKFLKQSDGIYESLLAFGNPKIKSARKFIPLKGAEEEVFSIAKAFPLSKVCVGKQATETFLVSNCNKYDVIHIASHGIFDAVYPMDSRVLLSPDSSNDGILTAKESYSIDLDGSLVILSACETGKTDVKNGDELIGFFRGFFFSGASSLIASLWKVDDIATKQLMTEFYNQLKYEQLTPEQSIKNSKLKMIKSDSYTHPYYWAAFTIFGMGR